MLNLTQYIKIYEGGQAGHMFHPFDYTDFTGNDLKELVNNLFAGKVEVMKEKLDGMNIMASMNERGEVVLSRNQKELNSENGGVLIKDLATRWEGKPKQYEVYSKSAIVIDKVFQKVGKEYFLLDDGTRKYINCECIIAGKTNNVPYATDRVAFHGYYLYKEENGKWIEIKKVEDNVDELYKAAEGIDAAKPRPNLVIKHAEEAAKYAEKFSESLITLFDNEGLSLNDSIEDWKKARYNKMKPEWIKEYSDELFERWFNDNKTLVKASVLKKAYADHYEELMNDKAKSLQKTLVKNVMVPLDNLFLSIGNELMSVLKGFVNDDADDVIAQLKKDITDIVELVKQKGSTEVQAKVEKNLQRLQELGNKYNAAEGIVITYKGRLMKLTGSFAPINQILGTRFDLEKQENK